MNTPIHFREPFRMAVVLSAATILAFAPDSYLPMLARAFLVQWALLFMGISLFALWKQQNWTALGGLFGSVLIIAQVISPPEPVVAMGDGPTLKIMHMNVLQPNIRFQNVIDLAVKSEADVISIQEVGPEWAQVLQNGLACEYPYMHIEPRSNCYGIAMFSKRPFIEVGTIMVEGSPFIEALVEMDGRPVRLLAVHTTSPISYSHFQERNEQFAQLARYLAVGSTPTVIIGDLNTVPWDHAFQRFCAQASLRPYSDGIQRTWPSVGPFALIPLDHLLVSDAVSPTSLTTFSIAGSDHRGLMAEIGSAYAR